MNRLEIVVALLPSMMGLFDSRHEAIGPAFSFAEAILEEEAKRAAADANKGEAEARAKLEAEVDAYVAGYVTGAGTYGADLTEEEVEAIRSDFLAEAQAREAKGDSQ